MLKIAGLFIKYLYMFMKSFKFASSNLKIYFNTFRHFVSILIHIDHLFWFIGLFQLFYTFWSVLFLIILLSIIKILYYWQKKTENGLFISKSQNKKFIKLKNYEKTKNSDCPFNSISRLCQLITLMPKYIERRSW